MKTLTPELLYTIDGIGSASGLIAGADNLFLISDNSGFLYEYNTYSQNLQRHRILAGDVEENIPKKIKPDFEAITTDENYFYIFGSGSTPSRNLMVTVDRLTKEVISHTDLSALYKQMREVAGISETDFNIEGVTHYNGEWFFFQRGNGAMSHNGFFQAHSLSGPTAFSEVELPKIAGIQATFTDAIVWDERIWFLATAENTVSTYEDGEVLGSLIGSVHPQDGTVENLYLLIGNHKFEGLTVKAQTVDSISFLLCEDNDTETLQAHIYNVKVPVV